MKLTLCCAVLSPPPSPLGAAASWTCGRLGMEWTVGLVPLFFCSSGLSLLLLTFVLFSVGGFLFLKFVGGWKNLISADDCVPLRLDMDFFSWI